MIPLASSDFEYVSQLVKGEAAIQLEKGKEYLVQTRLEPVVKSLGFSDIATLVQKIRTSKSPDLIRKVVESLTTHETSFFRDNEPFETLKNFVIPELIERNRSTKELALWCGATSSGQEPYSICMLLRENFPELQTWKLKFVASDVSRGILERARSGVYSQLEVNRGLPVRYLVKYFDKKGQDWIVKPELRHMIEFFEFNLLHPFVRIPFVDLVMLRNVLIYFDVAAKKSILNKLRMIIRPNGYLFLGAAETTMGIDESYERVLRGKTSCYKRMA